MFQATAILGYLLGWSHLHVLQVNLTGVVPEHPQRLDMPRPAQWSSHESMHMAEAVEWLNQHVCPTGQCSLPGNTAAMYTAASTLP